MRIFIMGRAGTGKDTLADYLVDEYNFKKYRLAQMVEDLCRDYFGMNGTKNRRMMIDVSEKMKNTFGIDFWIKALTRKAKREMEFGCYNGVVISDVRFPQEYRYFYRRGFYPVRVEAPREVCMERLQLRDGSAQLETLDDPTELALEGWSARDVFNSSTYTRLYQLADNLMDELREVGEFEEDEHLYRNWWDMGELFCQ